MKTRSTLTYSPGAFGPVLADLTEDSLGWQDFALCAESDPSLWHMDLGQGQHTRAKAICADCPVREECLEYALAYEDLPSTAGTYGVFGGLDPAERDAIRATRSELHPAA